MLERLELTAGIAKLLRLLRGHRGRNDNCCQDHGYAWVQHLTRRSSATAGGGELCFHFILHNSSFSLSVRRPAVGSSDWLGLCGAIGFAWIIDVEVMSDKFEAG